MTELPWYDDISLPALLRSARTSYGIALRAALAEAGCDDMPANGSYVIGAIARDRAPLSEIVRSLGGSKQAAGQLVDTLVTRGYLERSVDPEDRRRLTVSLTERGQAAAEVIRTCIDGIEQTLADQLGAEHVAHTRATLGALATLRADDA
jgi:DNA-binding MarR family transcriptional regulator